MLPIKKVTVGVQPHQKMFRVQTNWGAVADAVIRFTRKEKSFGSDYYPQIKTTAARDAVTLTNDDTGDLLTVTSDNIVFVKDALVTGGSLDLKKAMEQFAMLYEVVDSILNVSNVRRIGIVGESRVEDVAAPSARLLSGLTRLPQAAFPAKFSQRYEERFPTREGLAPDVAKDDFENVIYTFYDGSLDTQHPVDSASCFTLDYQKYSNPPIAREVIREAERMLPKFRNKWDKFVATLEELKVLNR